MPLTDNKLADIVLTAYQQNVGQFIQPNHLDTGLNDEQLDTSCDLLTTLELIVPGDSGFGNFKEYKITKLGLFVATSSGGLLKWIWEEKNKVNPSSLYKIINKPQDTTITADNLHIGDNYGNYNQSSSRDNALTNPITQAINPTNDTKPPKKSWLEIASWAAGIIATIIALYEFWIKHYFSLTDFINWLTNDKG